MIPLINLDTLKNLRFSIEDRYEGKAQLFVIGGDPSFGTVLSYDEKTHENVTFAGLSYGTLCNIYYNLDPTNSFGLFDRYLIERFLRFSIKPEFFSFSATKDWYEYFYFDDFDGKIFTPSEEFEKLVTNFNNLPTQTEKLCVWSIGSLHEDTHKGSLGNANPHNCLNPPEFECVKKIKDPKRFPLFSLLEIKNPLENYFSRGKKSTIIVMRPTSHIINPFTPQIISKISLLK